MSDTSNDIMKELDNILELGDSENELVALSSSLPNWQKDALRRIAQKGELNEEDKEILRTAMYADQNLDTLNHELIPLSSDHCKVPVTDGNRAALCSIGNIENVNQLAVDQLPLQFTPDGITLIYGDNGSGKSGYIRLAKKICRARIEEEILGNAYLEQQKTPSASVRWTTGNKEEISEFNWTPDQPPPDALSAISVFDTKNGNLYIDGQNRMEYLPFEVNLFKNLTDFCRKLQQDVLEKINNTENSFTALPDLMTTTLAASFVEEITTAKDENTLPSEERIIEFATWSEDKTIRLKELQQTAILNPIVQLGIRTRCFEVLTKLSEKIEVLENAFSQEQVLLFQQDFDALQKSKNAKDLAAGGNFLNMHFESVGSDIWQQFFRYAKQYAELANPNQEFPYIKDDARCVLCHQTLNDNAKQRFIQFDDFITGKAAEEHRVRLREYTTATTKFNGIQIQNTDDVKKMLVEFEILSEERKEIVADLLDFLDNLSKRKATILEARTLGTFNIITADIRYSHVLRAEAAKLKLEEENFHKLAEDSEFKQEQAQNLAELKAQKCLSENILNLTKYRSVREKYIRLKKCLESVNTGKLSKKVSKLREQYLTTELNAKIETEIKSLGLSYLKIKIKDKTVKGESDFESDIGLKIPTNKANILSEGEQRGLALACFLAEVSLRSPLDGIIVDDPVSSLDHQRIGLVAKRLVEEAAKGRQVIIFTHNILFYQEVKSQAAYVQIGLAKNLIYRHAEKGVGLIEESGIPYQARKVTERIKSMRSELATLIDATPPLDGGNYQRAVEGFCNELRKTWERLVETALLNNVVERFGYGVKTQSLRGVSVENKDYHRIFHAMKTLSNFSGHDEAPGKQGILPSPENLKQYLDEIENFRLELNERRKKLEKKRKNLEQPPPAEFLK